MSIKISVKMDTRKLERKLKQIAEKEIAKAAATAANRTAVSARKELTKKVGSVLNLKSSDIKKTIEIESKARPGMRKHFAVMKITKTQMQLIKYKAKRKAVSSARGPRIGVTVKVLKKGDRKLVKGAFIAKMKSGREGIWKRTGRTTKGGREGIRELYSLKVIDIVRDKRTRAFLRRFVRKRYPEVYKQRLKFHLDRAMGRL